MAVPKLAMIPSGYKAGKLYSILPTDGTGDFTVSRNSTATRINSDGLIETVGVNVPRLDYPTIGGCPELLVEPQVVQLVGMTEQFDNAYWTKNNLNTTGTPNWINQAIAPDGTLTAEKLIENNTNNQHFIFSNSVSNSAGDELISSVFAKKGERNFIRIIFGTGDGAYFNLNNGTPVLIAGGITAKIQDFGDGWYRCSISSTNTLLNDRSRIYVSDGTATYQGDGISGVFIWGANLYQGSNLYNYIPNATTGSVTKVADVITVTPPAGSTTITETVGGTDFVRTFATPYTVTNNRIQKITMI